MGVEPARPFVWNLYSHHVVQTNQRDGLYEWWSTVGQALIYDALRPPAAGSETAPCEAPETVKFFDEGGDRVHADANVGSTFGTGLPRTTGGVAQFIDQHVDGVAGFVARADERTRRRVTAFALSFLVSDMSTARAPLSGKTLFISGGSRGIGLAIAIRAAHDGANVALIAKTAEPHPKLEGTVYTAAEQIEAAGGRALPIVGDIRDESEVERAVAETVERFGAIDICVNNASAINLSGTEALEIKRYDLMQAINTRGTFVVSRACIPYLKRSENPHILTLSPPISLEPRWLGPHIGYAIAKYGMSHCALGFAAEFRKDGIASNALWPRTLIATAAVQNLLGGDQAMARARRPGVVCRCGVCGDHPPEPGVHGEYVSLRGRPR